MTNSFCPELGKRFGLFLVHDSFLCRKLSSRTIQSNKIFQNIIWAAPFVTINVPEMESELLANLLIRFNGCINL